MSEATLNAEEEQAPESESGLSAPDSSTGEVVFANRYRIQPGVVLQHLSTSSARAYPASDSEDPKRNLYALILDRDVPARLTAILAAKAIPHDALVKPVRWGQLDWVGNGREEVVIILPQPDGAPLLQTMESTIQHWTVREIKRDFLIPIVDLLRRMYEDRLSHRNIRPTNLFRSTSDGSVMSGQIYSAPPGYEQPSMFEPIERAMCPPIARGTGEFSDELFALGVTMMILGLGRNPVAGMDEDELMSRRLRLGSYSALLGDNKLHSELAPVVRALLRDEEHERWALADLANWVNSGRVNPSQPLPAARADRPFEFNGRTASNARELAYILTTDWSAAAKLSDADTIEKWVDRSLRDRELATDISECGKIGASGLRQMTEDIRLSRVIATLDPSGPIRFRRMAVMPDGFGPASVNAALNKDLASDYSDLVLGRMMTFWHEVQPRPKTWMLTASEVVDKAANFLSDTAAGFSIERCAYELNPALPCLSPLISNSAPLQPRDLIETLEREAAGGELLFDRHIAAFFAARITGRIDKELHDYARASGESDRRMAQLRLLAYVQSKNSSVKAKNLYDLFLDQLQVVLNDYKNVRLRQQLLKDARKAASKGSLNDLVRIIDDAKKRRWDERGFNGAVKRHAALEAEIRKLQTDEKRMQRQANLLGRQIAANVASIMSILVLAALIITRMS